MHQVLLNDWYGRIAVVKPCKLVNVFKSFGRALGGEKKEKKKKKTTSVLKYLSIIKI